MSAPVVPRPSEPAPPPEEKPFYGWRYLRHERSDGTVELEEVELTLEDVLHPQEGDEIPERPYQARQFRYLASVFDTRLPRLRGGLVLEACIVDWNVPGIRNHSPDISVFDRLRAQPGPNIGTFRLALWGGRCLCAIEIVSPETRVNDVVRKLDEYRQARVPLYILVDQEREGAPRRLVAYRWTRRAYKPVPCDAQGRVRLEALGLLLGLRDDQVVCYDAQTGEELGDYMQVTQARQAAEERVQQEATARAAEAAARQAAEDQARRETAAREAEAAARRAAEGRARREGKARAAAEERARQEAEARAADAERLRALEAEIRRLRGDTPG